MGHEVLHCNSNKSHKKQLQLFFYISTYRYTHLRIAAATHIPNHLKTFVHSKVQKSVKTNWEIAARESTVLHKCVCVLVRSCFLDCRSILLVIIILRNILKQKVVQRKKER